MNWKKAGLFLVLICVAAVQMAEAKAKPYQVLNRLRFEYDDNIRQLDDADKDSSFKIILQPELRLNMTGDQSFFSLRWLPSYVWWDNRPEDDQDFHQSLDFLLQHRFNPRLSLSIKDTLRITELPELIDDGTSVRQNNDFDYNSLIGSLSVVGTPNTRYDFDARYIYLRYEDDISAQKEDRDTYVAGFSVRHQLRQDIGISGEVRFEQLKYKTTEFTYTNKNGQAETVKADRGSDNFQLGARLEQILGPNLQASYRAGYQLRDFNDSVSGESSAPYAEAIFTILPSPLTRISAGLTYSQTETDVFPYTNTDKMKAFLSLAHDLTARIALYLATSYTTSSYDRDNLPEVTERLEEANADLVKAEIQDGDENILQVSARTSYKLNRSNWLELSWQYTSADSDLRVDFVRNRFGAGWKTKF